MVIMCFFLYVFFIIFITFVYTVKKPKSLLVGDSSTEGLPFILTLISSILFKKGLILKMKNIKSKRIGLFSSNFT